MEHIIVNPNAAYDKFKDKRVGTKGLGEMGGTRVGGDWQLCLWAPGTAPTDSHPPISFPDFSDRIGQTKRTGYESGEYEIVSRARLLLNQLGACAPLPSQTYSWPPQLQLHHRSSYECPLGPRPRFIPPAVFTPSLNGGARVSLLPH